MDLANYSSNFGIKNKIARILWSVAYLFFFRPFGTQLLKKYRIFILKCFGAQVEYSTHVYASAKIWAPWNLKMGNFSTLGPGVHCYNQGKITIGSNTVISQKSYLCASTHDFNKVDFPLYCDPIHIGDSVWIAADVFIGPGAIVMEGAVVGARSAVFKDVDAWTVVGGNPAKFIKKRIIN